MTLLAQSGIPLWKEAGDETRGNGVHVGGDRAVVDEACADGSSRGQDNVSVRLKNRTRRDPCLDT